jgi:hypothetical protein
VISVGVQQFLSANPGLVIIARLWWDRLVLAARILENAGCLAAGLRGRVIVIILLLRLLLFH